jgi:hypothetical protein
MYFWLFLDIASDDTTTLFAALISPPEGGGGGRGGHDVATPSHSFLKVSWDSCQSGGFGGGGMALTVHLPHVLEPIS